MNESLAITTKDSPWWAKLLERFGVNTCFTAVILYAVYCGGLWTADHIVAPIADAHIELLRSTMDEQRLQTLQLQKQTDMLEIISQTMADASQKHAAILKIVTQNAAKLDSPP